MTGGGRPARPQSAGRTNRFCGQVLHGLLGTRIASIGQKRSVSPAVLDVVRMTIRAGDEQIFPKPRGIEPLWSSVDDPIVYSTPSGSSEAENKPIDPAPAWLHPCNLRLTIVQAEEVRRQRPCSARWKTLESRTAETPAECWFMPVAIGGGYHCGYLCG